MDPEIKSRKSLPPLVEGKIHGYLKLVIDEVVWSERSFGEIKIFASWWGETVSAQFRPADVAKNITRPKYETTEIYAIRTNINLFQEYVENSERIELTIVSEENNVVVGTSKITDLLNVFESKPYIKYIPIINESKSKIGEIHVSMKLEYATKFSNMHLKPNKYVKDDSIDNNVPTTTDSFKYSEQVTSNVQNKLKAKENEIYKSILKSRRTKFQKPLTKGNEETMDELVTQIVARAQRLRGAVLRESRGEDVFDFSDISSSGSAQSLVSFNGNVKFWDYLSGREATSLDEHKPLSIVESISPTASSIDFTSDSFDVCKHNKRKIKPSGTSFAQTNSLLEKIYITPKENLLLDRVNSIRIFVESFALTPAGYRRVKSSFSSHHNNTFLHPTYFIQYDMTFEHVRLGKKKSTNNKSVKISSKKQTDQEIYFNHDGIYEISKLKSHTEYFVKFKMFIRHFNKKSLIELGVGTMLVNDIIKTKNWSTTQCICILNKGIKIGELSVIAELGSDFVHFGKQYIDDIISSKENIPSMRILQQLSNKNINKNKKRYKNATDIRPETHSELPSISTQVNRAATVNDLFATTNVSRRDTENSDSRHITVKDRENDVDEKALLRGFIYIAEGKTLSELNTYLICRAFWTEDKTRSLICTNTKNPLYRFSQIAPVVFDADLLNLMKDNYIIVEVYHRNNNNMDNLLGLVKLSIHPLYIAYRDSHVLPRLLSSKYPVVSVDDWVPIIDPVTGQSHGQLYALVALGTTEQIALLATSRNLRNTYNASNCLENLSELVNHPETGSQSDRRSSYVSDLVEKKMCCLDLKTQECQTDISTIEQLKLIKISQEETNSEHLILHNLVDRLTEVLNIDKGDSHNEISKGKKRVATNAKEHICIGDLNLNSSCQESDDSSIRHNCRLPIETYRSVGVGAEYEEEIHQQPNIDYTSKVFDLPSIIQNKEDDSMDSESSQTMFRAVVEIECALYLPKVEKSSETFEPSTYVSFQANKFDPSKHLNSCMITDVFPHSCNPKWNWKNDVKLPVELLLRAEKRLILKVWRIADSDKSMQINLERDVVIGFSAIDVSVLISGFPIISGWFHIMDFSGECNGQIKVSIAPLDNLSLFRKPMSTVGTTRIPVYDTSELNWLPLNVPEVRTDDAITKDISSTVVQTETTELTENQLADSMSRVDLEDASMPFLSLSLKKKLTELDEITKRLELRLRDITNAAFEDDIDNEFDLNESNSDVENNDCKSAGVITSVADTVNNSGRARQVLESNTNQNTSSENEIRDCSSEPFANVSETNRSAKIKSGPYYVANSHPEKNVINCQVQHGNEEFLMPNIRRLGNSPSDYPERGTKTHINYLLDKLSLQFPPQSRSTLTVPMMSNTDLLTNSPQNGNVMQNNDTCSSSCNQATNACATPKEAGGASQRNIESFKGHAMNCSTNENKHLREASLQSQIANKMSTVIRDELTSEENSNASKYDGLTTYLIASNIRHMDSNSVFNPLLYQHLVPDFYYSSTLPEKEAMEQLDDHYAKDLIVSANNQLGNVEKLTEIGASSSASAQLFRTVQFGSTENIDNDDVKTTVRKVSSNDLLESNSNSNSTESTTTISPEKTSVKQIDLETTEHSYSTSSEILDLVLSRQAPDGGNPMEDITKQSILQQMDDDQDSSPNSCN